MLTEKAAALTALCKKHGVAELDVFGSVVRDDFDITRSDIDFLVRFHPTTGREHRLNYFGLLEALEELFSRKVDLVEMDAVTNPYVRSDIEATRERLYAA